MYNEAKERVEKKEKEANTKAYEKAKSDNNKLEAQAKETKAQYTAALAARKEAEALKKSLEDERTEWLTTF